MDFTPILKGISTYFPPSLLTKKLSSKLKVLIISPHPDDECITSSLALRLLKENNCLVLNVAVTLGSNERRKRERKGELKKACLKLGFKNKVLSEDWKKKERELKDVIKNFNPQVIIAPHEKDLHPTHVKTSLLLKSVLQKISHSHFIIAWSEYWGQLKKPNLLLEVPEEVLNFQMRALLEHQGEISRNPYHLRLPGWMMDNVRRGSEIIKNYGGESPQVPFGILYQLQIYKDKKFQNLDCFPYISSHQDIAQIFKLIFEAAAESKKMSKCE